LFDRVAEFAHGFSPFDAGELGVAVVPVGDGRAFIALKPEGALKELRSFEASRTRTPGVGGPDPSSSLVPRCLGLPLCARRVSSAFLLDQRHCRC
jgi:hypothetical protein